MRANINIYCFVISVKGTAKTLKEMSLLMTLIIRLIAKTQTAASSGYGMELLTAVCTLVLCSVQYQGSYLWCTWATVMAHFFANSSLASSLGQGLLRCEQKYSLRISVACLLKFRLFRLQKRKSTNETREFLLIYSIITHDSP